MIGRYGPPIFGIFKGIEGSYNVALMKAVVNKKICNPDYFFKFLQTDDIRSFVEKSSKRAAGQDGVRKELLAKYPVPLPSLSEQKRIVEILDEAFAAIDKAKVAVEKNLQNAKELFESYVDNIFSVEGSTWERKEFKQLIEVLTDYHANGSYEILKKNVELKEKEDYAWMVRSTDFENEFQNDKRYISEESYNFLQKSRIFGNEIIISKIGNAGKVYLMPKIERPCSLAMNLFLIRLNKADYSSKYVYYYLNSKDGQRQISSRVLGTTTKTITKDNVRSISILCPNLKKQIEVEKRLDEILNQTKELKKIYQQKLNDLEELKKSILQKAFTGELTAATKTLFA